MTQDELKRKLRQLKKLEGQIRFGNTPPLPGRKYVWDEFFSTKDAEDGSVKYTLKQMLKLEHQKLKEVFDEYFFHVYFQYYKENGIILKGMYDVNLLSILGLPPDSTYETIKGRFRELAKKYHPDHGGDSRRFIELMDIYHKLMGED